MRGGLKFRFSLDFASEGAERVQKSTCVERKVLFLYRLIGRGNLNCLYSQLIFKEYLFYKKLWNAFWNTEAIHRPLMSALNDSAYPSTHQP